MCTLKVAYCSVTKCLQFADVKVVQQLKQTVLHLSHVGNICEEWMFCRVPGFSTFIWRLCSWNTLSTTNWLGRMSLKWPILESTTTTLHPFNGLFSKTTWASRHQKGKPFWILLEQEMMGGSGISSTICKSFAHCSREITMPVPHHSVFTDQMPFCCPTNRVKALKATGCKTSNQ